MRLGWPTLAAGGAVAGLLYLWRRHRLLNPETTTLPPKVTSCTLVWAAKQPCFCHATIRMDLSVLTPAVETVAAIFGSPCAASVTIRDESDETVDAASLQAGKRYTVLVEGEQADWLPIKQIASHLDEATVQRLSAAFYGRVWADAEAVAFRTIFVNNAESAASAADAQWRWLIEMWGELLLHARTCAPLCSALLLVALMPAPAAKPLAGGPKRYSERFGQGTLITRMLSKHGAARMQYRFCRRWLEHMVAAMAEVEVGGLVAESIGRYWLHFFGFFEMSVAERLELRAIALPSSPG